MSVTKQETVFWVLLLLSFVAMIVVSVLPRAPDSCAKCAAICQPYTVSACTPFQSSMMGTQIKCDCDVPKAAQPSPKQEDSCGAP